jgi:ribonuclease HI
MTRYIIYTDGSCDPNPGNGGYAAIILPCTSENPDGPEMVIAGNEPDTTNNVMEIRALIEALRAINEPANIEVHSDSTYVVDAFNKGWLNSWQANGWTKANRKPVENVSMWKALIAELDRVAVGTPTFTHVTAHKGDYYNERCDNLAKFEAAKLKMKDDTVEALPWVEEVSRMTYAEIAREWGMDDEHGEPIYPV